MGRYPNRVHAALTDLLCALSRSSQVVSVASLPLPALWAAALNRGNVRRVGSAPHLGGKLKLALQDDGKLKLALQDGGKLKLALQDDGKLKLALQDGGKLKLALQADGKLKLALQDDGKLKLALQDDGKLKLALHPEADFGLMGTG